MVDEKLGGADFKKQLRAGEPKMGLFLNSHSPTVAEQLAYSGYDWLLVDTQHGPMGFEKLSAMLGGIASGGAKSLVRVEGYHDRGGIQQALDLGADGVLIPYINTAAEARQAVSCAKYPTAGTRAVYFPQRSMNKDGLLGYAGNWNNNGIVALQVETADCIKNIAEIAAVPAWTSFSSAKTIFACPWASSKNTNSRTCTLRPNSVPPPRASSKTHVKIMSFSDYFCLARRASANFSTKVFPSSASATIYITYSPKPERTSATSRKLLKKKASPGPAVLLPCFKRGSNG